MADKHQGVESKWSWLGFLRSVSRVMKQRDSTVVLKIPKLLDGWMDRWIILTFIRRRSYVVVGNNHVKDSELEHVSLGLLNYFDEILFLLFLVFSSSIVEHVKESERCHQIAMHKNQKKIQDNVKLAQRHYVQVDRWMR